MDKQQVSLHEETISHETAGEETWLGGDASLDTIELRPVSFSAKAIQHGRHPTNAGRMEHPDAICQPGRLVRRGDGDVLALGWRSDRRGLLLGRWLSLDDGVRRHAHDDWRER